MARLTKEEAIAIARSVAEQEGWPWREPIWANTYRNFFLFGTLRWHIRTNSDHRGGNVNVHLIDATGEVIIKGFADR